jgi:hypothetical protein
MHGYLEYLHRSASLARRLSDAGSRVAFGEHDMVKLADDERETLENCPHRKPRHDCRSRATSREKPAPEPPA